MKTLFLSMTALALTGAPAFAKDCAWSKTRTAETTADAVRYVGNYDESPNIVETAEAAGAFGTLLAAAQAAGLAEALAGEGPLTVFAPTDAAFDDLPEGTVENLLKPENKAQLAAILKLHVIPARVTSSDLAGKTLEVETLGGTVSIDATDGVTVGGASVTQADIMTSNGVIHVIDKVILPAQ